MGEGKREIGDLPAEIERIKGELAGAFGDFSRAANRISGLFRELAELGEAIELWFLPAEVLEDLAAEAEASAGEAAL